jgi:selenocysteine lyase/cysteine desulfurase
MVPLAMTRHNGEVTGALIDRDQYAALAHGVYLNQASLGLIPRAAIDASTRFLTEVAQHGNLRLSDEAEAAVLDGLRAEAATLLGAPEEAIAVIGGAGEGLSQMAALLSSPDGEVVLIDSDFPSVTYPWLAAQQRLGMGIRWVVDDPGCDMTEALTEAISDRTTVVCVSAVQFATGSQVDVPALVSHARRVGAYVVVDVTQLAGAGPVAMSDWGADALVCSGYKWLSAPTGVALLSVSEQLAAATPAIVGWKGTPAPFDFHPRELMLAPDARRYELSSMSYSAAAGLRASIGLLSDTGLDAIADHARTLGKQLLDSTAPLGWVPYRPIDGRSACAHIISLRHPDAVAADVQPWLVREHHINVSARVGGIRVSLHAYNSTEDVHALAAALERYLAASL